MSLKRALISGGVDMPRAMRAGDGYIANPEPAFINDTAAHTIVVSDLAGGLIIRDTQSADRIDTTPTGTLIAAAFPNMDIGDSFIVKFSNIDTAYQITLAGGTDVTAAGNLIVLELTMKELVFIKTAATTFTMHAL